MSTESVKERVCRWVEAPIFQHTIIALIVVNAVILGLETSPAVMHSAGFILKPLDGLILAVFVVELLLRLYAHRSKLLRDPWGLFDLFVVTIALIPASGPFAVLRALRILRVLRLISAVPSMRKVVEALLRSLPGLGSIIAILGLIFYVAAVMATKLFGEAFPDWFGSVGASLYSLFQIMTLESWSMGIVRPVMQVYPMAWLFFVPFILIATFTMLNLFIAVVVNAMQSQHELEQAGVNAEKEAISRAEHQELLAELRAIRQQLAEQAAARRHPSP
jgi:voltage-gated sodium channel